MLPWIASKLAGKAGPYLFLGVSAVAVVLLSTLWVQTVRLDSAHKRIGALETKLQAQVDATHAAADANEICVAEVKALTQQIAEMVESRRVERIKWDRLLAERETIITEAQNEADRQRQARRDLWRQTQSCEGLQTLVVDTACAPIADRLRERSRGAGGD